MIDVVIERRRGKSDFQNDESKIREEGLEMDIDLTV